MKKKILFLIISIFLVILILFSSSYALLFKVDETDKQSYKTGILDITSESLSGSVTINNQLPMSDSDGENSTPYIFRITNKGNLSYKFNIMLLSTTTDNQIEAQYIKVKVNEDEPIKLNSLTNGIILSDITLKPNEYIDVTLRVWLDINTPNTQIGKTFNAKITTEGQAIYTEVNLDKSGANEPDLVDGLIPVVYYNNKWVKADESNSSSTYQWYDYDNKKWANAVLVTSTNRSTYQNASAGTSITESDILAYYVWIPRYKYKVWNINKVIGTDSYSARTKGIDIMFENEKESTGTISCTYSYAAPSSSANSPNETCTGSNGDYYTHPAFTFGSDNIRGLWMGKFEISSSNLSASNGGGKTSSLTLKILPNVTSWRYNTISNFNTVVQNMQVSSNIYGLSTSRANTDSHMITNMEWGAVAYLTNSKYGRCTNGSCTEVTTNNCTSYTTGIGADSVSEGGSSSTCTPATNKYNGEKGVLASTTENITGVYDMNGGANEYVMGNISSANGSYTFYPSGSGFSSSWYTSSTAKYVTTYAYDSSNLSNQTAYNRGKLGDATSEVVLSTGGTGGWYGDYTYFSYSNYAWFPRGGMAGYDSRSGIFSFGPLGGPRDTGAGYEDPSYSTRAVLVFLK